MGFRENGGAKGRKEEVPICPYFGKMPISGNQVQGLLILRFFIRDWRAVLFRPRISPAQLAKFWRLIYP
jgi:hypothetical protein